MIPKDQTKGDHKRYQNIINMIYIMIMRSWNEGTGQFSSTGFQVGIDRCNLFFLDRLAIWVPNRRLACGFGNLGDSIAPTKSHIFATFVSELLKQPKQLGVENCGQLSYVSCWVWCRCTKSSFACERTCSAVVGTVSATNGSELAHESVGLSEVAVYIERLSRVGSLHQFLYYLQWIDGGDKYPVKRVFWDW